MHCSHDPHLADANALSESIHFVLSGTLDSKLFIVDFLFCGAE